ncbi:hypothetical protein N6H05_19380 [Sphingobium sp. WTD-1]|uniref:hypothetical protein n=1 Tax=Sphingobium sp. WTD-1 TaxID=2979467 RepID=UPI0024DE7515|nr:hypothetical protein [Sphingobium sp. WTD-1]WIA55172.1 hypothetical protein N6H05_19380 [Sphingobium sp. WTD-1]
MGMDRLENAVTDLEQRMALLEECIALVVYREEEAKSAAEEAVRRLQEADARLNAVTDAAVRVFTLKLNTKDQITGFSLKEGDQ